MNRPLVKDVTFLSLNKKVTKELSQRGLFTKTPPLDSPPKPKEILFSPSRRKCSDLRPPVGVQQGGRAEVGTLPRQIVKTLFLSGLGGDSKGGGFVKSPLWLSSLVTFLFNDKKVT